MRGKINNSTTDFHHSHVVVAEEADESTTDEDDYGREERGIQERQEALRQRGRESYTKRKEGSPSSANTTPASTHSNRLHNPLYDDNDNDDDDDGDGNDDEGDIFYNESMGNGAKKPPRKKRKSDTADPVYHPSDNGSDTEDEGYHDQKPGSAKRRVSSGRLPSGPGRSPSAMAVITTPPSRSKRQGTSNPIVSRFKEGSMRDRASAVPPREIVGTLPTSSPARPEDGEEAPMSMSTRVSGLSNIQSIRSLTARSTDVNGTAKGSFTFGGLASFIPNPFKIVKEAKEAWDRQKQLHETRERKKKILRDRKMRGQMAYMDLKKAGAMQGYSGNAAAVMGANAIVGGSSSRSTGVPLASGNYTPDYAMGYDHSIGRAYSTDESRPVSSASEQGGRRGRSELVTSFASDVTMKGTGEGFGTERPHRNSCETSETEQDKNNFETTRRSLDFVTSPCSENFSRKSISRSKVIVPPPPSRAPPPPPLSSSTKATVSGGKFEDVKMLVKKKSKVFASTFSGRGEEGTVNTSSRTTSREGPTKREIKRQEHLQKKVSNLEELLDKARRELENALDTTINGSVPLLPPIPPMPKGLRREILPRPKTTRESVVSGEDTEGEETEVDDTPLSPEMNGSSIGGSFMAKTAEMTIMESVEEAQHELPEPANVKGKASSRVFGILPGRTSKLNLGRRRVSGAATGTVAGEGSASVLRPQSKSMADMKGKSSPPPPQTLNGRIPPMPRLVGVNGGRK